MKYLFTLLFLLPICAFGQSNYVQREGNSYTPGQFNIIFGPYAGNTTMTGESNTFIGSNSALYKQSGSSNTFLGAGTGYFSQQGSHNTFVGVGAGYYTTSDYNTFVGSASGTHNTTGDNNTFLGNGTGVYNTIGIQNTFLGARAGLENTTGNNNTFIGFLAGYRNTTGVNNILIGPSSGTALTTGGNNVLLGANTQPTSASLQNAVAIGSNARVALDNAIVLGDPTNTSIAVGIGTDSPQFPLDVRGTINLRNNGRIKFAHLSNPLRNGTTDRFLTVNEEGETELARYRISIDNVNQWSDKVFFPTYQLKSLSQVEQHIQQHGHLPDVPSAEQVKNDGIDLVKMNALLLQKVEELTLYSIEQQKRIEKLERMMKEKN